MTTARMDQARWRAAVLADWRALAVAPLELRADREVMLSVVRQKGTLMAEVQGPLALDRQLALAAMCQDPTAYHCLAPELQADEGLLLDAARKNLEILVEAPQHLRESKVFMLQ
ncbi:unnamed protein product, partial [Prorocentrum cordatum]